MKAKTQLGRGMAALLKSNSIANELSENQDAKMTNQNTYTVSIQNLVANREQPRRVFKENDLRELAASIKENGIIQPIIVSPLEDGKFEIIAGERRYRASKMVGLEQVPVVIKRVTKKDSLVMAIIENIQRSDLNCVEEALAYYKLMNEFSLTQEEVAKKLGKERSSIANYLRILKLPREVLTFLQKDLLSLGHAKVLAAIKDPTRLVALAKLAAEDKLSVRDLEKEAKRKGSTENIKKPAKKANSKYNLLKNKLERKTGFHMDIKAKKDDKGELVIKFTNAQEFNTIYEYFMN